VLPLRLDLLPFRLPHRVEVSDFRRFPGDHTARFLTRLDHLFGRSSNVKFSETEQSNHFPGETDDY
jgi:hypothetical protein